jgi:hypothetical protein
VFEVPKFGFGLINKHDKQMSTRHLIVECTWCTYLILKFEDQDQTQDEDEDEV